MDLRRKRGRMKIFRKMKRSEKRDLVKQLDSSRFTLDLTQLKARFHGGREKGKEFYRRFE